jgi:hypothetical protein
MVRSAIARIVAEYGPGEQLTLDSLAIALVVDEIYVDRIGPIVR